ncbi:MULTISPECIES: PDR/VanB family oxidoreductase [Paraburkholderia]|uniref:Oxidoreductase n=1 Tax=Paraburkholderia podalyriae TaxID=1938811 RepID=A0ABR7PTJ9_9BURK|nr:PDR/VanB family oxidoreductase [Paraburkholderia podalyriae]MBC8749568.1 oxidoreductase [Paraburkholderia podalyriae]
MKTIITRRVAVATDTLMFELADPSGDPLPVFDAGAHIDVHVGGMVRQYSLCNSPHDSSFYRIGVLRDPASRGGSIAMHELGEGAMLEIGAPKNHFPLTNDARHSILLAGGIGITPVLCMTESLAAESASFELHYCVRNHERLAFRERLIEFADVNIPVHFYIDEDGNTPRIELTEVLAKPDAGKHLYVCGPAGFISAVMDTATAIGWKAHNLHREYFGGIDHQNCIGDGAFQVMLSSSGQTVDVAPNQTVVEALRKAGVEIPVSCEQGVCGTCLTRVLDGQPAHRDLYLTEEERAANDQFLPCCSRARSALLVLDL